MIDDLDAQLHAAYASGDKRALVALYRRAAAQTPSDNARAFFLTQALVFALETGDTQAAALKQTLVEMGRDVQD